MTPTKQETHLWINFNLAHRKIHSAMERALAAEGLPSLKSYDVLWAVEMAGAEGVRAQKLKTWLLFEQSNLSRVLRGLVEQGLIEESVCEADRRAKLLRISEKGAALRLRMWRVYGEQIHAHMQALDQDGRGTDMRRALQAFLGDGAWTGGWWPD